MAASTSTMSEKLEESAPYNIFYNAISELPETLEQSNSIVFTDLLCPSLGKLKCSLQITFKLDIDWLMKQYQEKSLGEIPLTILCGEDVPQREAYIQEHFPNVTYHCVKLEGGVGSHHSKIGIYVYDDESLRVVVSTANLKQEPLDHYIHGFWVSPRCPKLPKGSSSSSGESRTKFKSSLLVYLKDYQLPSILNDWIDYVEAADFSQIKVFLVTSSPGVSSFGDSWSRTHLQQVQNLLLEHCQLPTGTNWPVIAQTSCLGKYGNAGDNWLTGPLLSCLASSRSKTPVPPFKIIYPSKNNAEKGLFGTEIIKNGLRYATQVHYNYQQWIVPYLYQWKGDQLGRSKVMPHVKTYCRMSPEHDKMAWFLFSTANLTPKAWGQRRKVNGRFKIVATNYELGIMFFPKFFDEEYFTTSVENNPDVKVFPLLFDLPLTKYGRSDQPWTSDQWEKEVQKY